MYLKKEDKSKLLHEVLKRTISKRFEFLPSRFRDYFAISKNGTNLFVFYPGNSVKVLRKEYSSLLEQIDLVYRRLGLGELDFRRD